MVNTVLQRLAVVFAVAVLGGFAIGGCDDGGGKSSPVDATTDTTDTNVSETTSPVCGNGTEETGEQCDDGNTVDGDGCEADCTATVVACNNNGTCDAGENTTNCAADCPPVCNNDGTCAAGETLANCPADCTVAVCNDDGTCAAGETTVNCPADCNAADCNNDGTCDAGETLANCPADCPAQGTDLGTVACDGTLSDITTSAAMAAQDVDTYTITFSNEVMLSGTLSANGTGDLDFYLYEPTDGTVIFGSAADGDEAWTNASIPAGSYAIDVEAYVGADSGYSMTLSLDCIVCGDGAIGGSEQCDDGGTTAGNGCDATCQIEAGYDCTGEPSVCATIPSYACGDAIPPKTSTAAMAASEHIDTTVIFTSDVMLSGTLNAAAGDVDFFVYDEQHNTVFSSEAIGNETWANIGLLAGTYSIVVFAYDDIASGYALTLSTACVSCGDAIYALNLEACDDGNAVTGDGCESDCTLTAGFCFAETTYGAATLADQSAFYSTTYDLIYVDGALNADADVLTMYLVNSRGGFTTSGVVAGTYEITGDDADPNTCGLCVYVGTDKINFPISSDGIPANDSGYFATAGTLVITSVSPNITGTLSNLTLTHMEEDSNGDLVPAADSCVSAITSASFDALVE